VVFEGIAVVLLSALVVTIVVGSVSGSDIPANSSLRMEGTGNEKKGHWQNERYVSYVLVHLG
jgi:hypothetical protein